MIYEVELSRRWAAIGLAIVVVIVAAAALALWMGSTSVAETLIERRLSRWYLLAVGVGAVGVAINFGRSFYLAWCRRDSLIALDEEALELQTLRGRRRIVRGEIRSISCEARGRGLTVVDGQHRSHVTVLRPEGSTWSEVAASLASLLHVRVGQDDA